MFKVKEALDELLTEKLNDPLSKEGFILKGGNAFQRKNNGHLEEVIVIINKIRGCEEVYVQINVALKFKDMQKCLAELRCDKRFRSFRTMSISVTNMGEEGEIPFFHWKLDESTDIDAMANEILFYVDKYGKPFWEKYDSIEDIIYGIETDGEYPRRGTTYRWDLSAAYWAIGDIENAIKTLEEWEDSKYKPKDEEIERAIEILKSNL